MPHGHCGHPARPFAALVQSSVIVRAFQLARIVETIRTNNELAARRTVNVLPVRSSSGGPCGGIIRLICSGIKQTEADKYPLKGYLAIREGDILCVPQNSSTMAKHMADLVGSHFLSFRTRSTPSL